MRYCPGCKLEKQASDFAKNSARKSGLQSYCRSCKAKHDNKYYRNNKQTHLNRVKQYLMTNRQNLWHYLEGHPCVDCGETNPVVLEFDHIAEKSGAISLLMRSKYSWTAIRREIEKCEVRCANCHRVRTAKQLGWYQFLEPTLQK